jgi:pimeloyl-ACP methyl ester carboxylesterase
VLRPVAAPPDLGGMGWKGWLAGPAQRFFIDVIDRFGTIKHGDPAYIAQQFMKAQKVDQIAARLLLGSVDDTPPGLWRITQPVLVVCGDVDQDNGSAPKLAETLPMRAMWRSRHAYGLGDAEGHGEAMVAFLTEE